MTKNTHRRPGPWIKSRAGSDPAAIRTHGLTLWKWIPSGETASKYLIYVRGHSERSEESNNNDALRRIDSSAYASE